MDLLVTSDNYAEIDASATIFSRTIQNKFESTTTSKWADYLTS